MNSSRWAPSPQVMFATGKEFELGRAVAQSASVIDVLQEPKRKMETSFPSFHFLRVGKKTSQVTETLQPGPKVNLQAKTKAW